MSPEYAPFDGLAHYPRSISAGSGFSRFPSAPRAPCARAGYHRGDPRPDPALDPTIFSATIVNYTREPVRRIDFDVSISRRICRRADRALSNADQYRAPYDLRKRVKDRLHQAGIAIPVPRQAVAERAEGPAMRGGTSGESQ
jgi:hypothetical protein